MNHEPNEVYPAVAPVLLTSNTHLTTTDTDERKERLRLLANVFIELFLEHRNRIAESPAEFAEAA